MNSPLTPMPLVSVVMSAYNAEQTISRTIESVRSQTYTNWELLIVDDASTDSTVQQIKAIEDKRIVLLINDKNQHISYSTNRAINTSKGKYIAIIDSDDCWLTDKLEKQITYLEAFPEAGACFTWCTLVDQNGVEWTEKQDPLVRVYRQENRSRLKWLHDLLLNGNCLCHPSVVYRRTSLEKSGLYDVALAQLLDYECYLRLLRFTDIHIICEPLVVVRRLHENNKSNSAESGSALFRVNTESAMVVCDYIATMPPKLFSEVFTEELQVVPFDPRLEIFEKGSLLLSRYHNIAVRIGGMRLIRQCISDPLLLTYIQSKTNFDQFAFYDQSRALGSLISTERSLDEFYEKKYLPQLSLRKVLKAKLKKNDRVFLFLFTLKHYILDGREEAERLKREYLQAKK